MKPRWLMLCEKPNTILQDPGPASQDPAGFMFPEERRTLSYTVSVHRQVGEGQTEELTSHHTPGIRSVCLNLAHDPDVVYLWCRVFPVRARTEKLINVSTCEVKEEDGRVSLRQDVLNYLYAFSSSESKAGCEYCSETVLCWPLTSAVNLSPWCRLLKLIPSFKFCDWMCTHTHTHTRLSCPSL